MKTNNLSIEERLRNAVHSSVPDVLDGILAECENRQGALISMTKQEKPRWITYAAAAAAFVVVLGGVLGFTSYRTATTVDSIIGLDVNPSIELTVNKKDKVISADAINEDAVIVLADMNLKGVDLDIAVNALIGSMLEHGYINDLQNSVLVTVENSNKEKSAKLEKDLTKEIDKAFKASNVKGAVVAQEVSTNDALTQLAKDNNISPGKATLIQSILDQDATKTFEDLAKLSVTQLQLLTQSQHIKLDNTTTAGSPSRKAYIDKNEAIGIALAHAKTTMGDVARLHWEFDSENGKMIYEVQFILGDMEYEYDIDATTGDVIKWDMETADISIKPNKPVTPNTPANSNKPDTPNSSKPEKDKTNSSGKVGKEKAKDIALTNAGATASDVSWIKATDDKDDGIKYYDIEFVYGDYKYEYEIDVYSGAILDSDKELYQKKTNGKNNDKYDDDYDDDDDDYYDGDYYDDDYDERYDYYDEYYDDYDDDDYKGNQNSNSNKDKNKSK